MMLRELHKYFPSTRSRGAPSRTTFLNLPQYIRRRIYLDAGLVSQSPIYLNYLAEEDSCIQKYDPHFPESWPIEDEDYITGYSKSLSHFLDGPLPWPRIQLNRDCVCMDNGPAWCECDAFPWQLLYVSNAIANEVSAIFYSENHFTVFRDRIGGIAVLGSLSCKAISQITSLSIHLNVVEEEGRRNDRFPDCHAMCTTLKVDQAFRKEKKWNERVSFREWQDLWRILRPNINQDRLKLFLTCDMVDVELADDFLRPILQAPVLQLRQCSIRLSSGNIVPANRYYPRLDALRELAALARLTAEQLTSQPLQRPFRYGDLPKEIRLQILEHTELVSQFDLAWTRHQPWALKFHPLELTYQPLKSKFYEHRRFRSDESRCCEKCSPAADVCSCFFRHGAFSTTCTCWTMPIQFFLVDHQMKDDAELVFYSNNHFLILPRPKTENTNLGIYDFLTHLPDNGLRYLRAISTGGLDVYHTSFREFSQWRACLKIINNKMNPGKLRLTIDLGFDKERIGYLYGGDYGHVSESSYVKEAEKVWSFGRTLATHFLKQTRLKDLFFHFKWPFEDHKDVIPQDRGMLLEQMVMGESYDGIARGKNERRHRWNGHQCGWDEECSECS